MMYLVYQGSGDDSAVVIEVLYALLYHNGLRYMLRLYSSKSHTGDTDAADVINHNGRKVGRFKPRRFW